MFFGCHEPGGREKFKGSNPGLTMPENVIVCKLEKIATKFDS